MVTVRFTDKDHLSGVRIASITMKKPEDALCSTFMDVQKLGFALTERGMEHENNAIMETKRAINGAGGKYYIHNRLFKRRQGRNRPARGNTGENYSEWVR